MKAFVNFNGTGTPAIRGSLNVTSITDNGTGDYTVNFTTALADANFAAISSIGTGGGGSSSVTSIVTSISTTTTQIKTFTSGGATNQDNANIYLAMFR